MSVIDRYVARSYIAGFVILGLIFMGFFTLVDLMVNLDDFTNNPNATFLDSVGYMWEFYRYNWPLYFAQFSGPVMSIAAAFTLGNMLRNNELTALIAAGMPLQRLVVPILGVTLLLIGASVANRELLIPQIGDKIARTKNDVVGTRAIGIPCAIDDTNRILSARHFHPREGTLQFVYIIEPQGQGRIAYVVQALEATYNPAKKNWKLVSGKRVRPADPSADPGGLGSPVREDPVDEYAFGLNPEQLVLRRASQWADYLSLPQLNTLLQSRHLPNRPAIVMSRHSRITGPLVQFLLVALAAPFFLLRSPGNVIGAAGKSLLLCGVFFGVVFASQTLLPDERYAALAVWAPILLFGPIAMVRLASVRT